MNDHLIIIEGVNIERNIYFTKINKPIYTFDIIQWIISY